MFVLEFHYLSYVCMFVSKNLKKKNEKEKVVLTSFCKALARKLGLSSTHTPTLAIIGINRPISLFDTMLDALRISYYRNQ